MATVSFYYRVSSELGNDYFTVLLDNELLVKESGTVGWTKVVKTGAYSGKHLLRVEYGKDTNTSEGEDRAFIDQLSYTDENGVTQTEDFEDDTVRFAPTGDWARVQTTPQSGAWCFASKVITHSQNSEVVFTLEPSVPCPVLLHTGQYREAGTTAWLQIPGAVDLLASPLPATWTTDAGLVTGKTYEWRVGVRRTGEPASANVWSVVWTFATSVPFTQPVADFAIGGTGLIAEMKDLSYVTQSGATIKTWYWKIQDSLGTVIFTSGAQFPTFSLPTSGAYTFSLTITDSNAQTDTETRTKTYGAGTTYPPYTDPLVRYVGWVLVEQEDGTFLDLTRVATNSGGYENRVASYSVKDDIDLPTANATVRVRLNTPNGSLAPLSISPLNLGTSPTIYPGKRRLIIQYDALDNYHKGGANDWIPVFHGVIDTVDAGGGENLIAIDARDRFASLLKAGVREAEPIGDPAGTPLTMMIQLLLDRWTAPGQWIVYAPVDPQWNVNQFMPEFGPLLEISRETVNQRGFVFRYWRDDAAKVFRPTILQLDNDFDPATDTPKFTFPPSGIRDITRHAIDATTVVNQILGRWEGVDGQVLTEYVEDVASMDKFESIFGIISEDKAGQISTSSEMRAMITAALHALRDPGVDSSKRIPYLVPEIKIGHYCAFPPYAKVYGETQYLAVKAFELFWSDTEKYTIADMRGRAVGQHALWLRSTGGAVGSGTGGGTGGGDTVSAPQAPDIQTDSRSSSAEARVWVSINERGDAVTAVRFYHRFAQDVWIGPNAPNKGPGMESLVRGGSLGAGQHEFYVPYSGNTLVYVKVDVTLASGGIETREYAPIDPDSFPRVLTARVEQKDVLFGVDDDTRSVRLAHSGGTWTMDVDVTGSGRATVPVPIGAVWNIQLTAFNTTVANRGTAGELAVVYPSVVAVSGDPVGPQISGFKVFSPNDVDPWNIVVRFGIVGDATGHTMRISARARSTEAWSDITQSVNPPPNPPVAATTDYKYFTDYRYVDGGNLVVTQEARVEVLNASGTRVGVVEGATSWNSSTTLAL